MSTSELNVLVVEDNEDDVTMLREVFDCNERLQIEHTSSNGEEALTYLRMQDEHQQPDLLLVDINMPTMNGLELLRALKADDKLAAIPVLVFTTSERHEDIEAAYSLGASSYISKPADFSQFLTIFEQLSKYWGDIARLPSVA